MKIPARFLVVMGLATVLSSVAVNLAPCWTTRCPPEHHARMLPLELARSGDEALELINGEPAKTRTPQPATSPSPDQAPYAACTHSELEAMLFADTIFLCCYSVFNLAIFLFVTASGRVQSRRPWQILGAILTAVMFSGDLLENQFIRNLIDLAVKNQPAAVLAKWILPLEIATTSKWIALGIAAACLGLLYRRHSKLRLVYGLSTAALIGVGLIVHQSAPVAAGMLPMILLWLAFLIEAIAVLRGRHPFVAKPGPPTPEA
jgi:hypothetical protein